MPHQFGLSTRAGTEAVSQLLRAATEACPGVKLPGMSDCAQLMPALAHGADTATLPAPACGSVGPGIPSTVGSLPLHVNETIALLAMGRHPVEINLHESTKRTDCSMHTPSQHWDLAQAAGSDDRQELR